MGPPAHTPSLEIITDGFAAGEMQQSTFRFHSGTSSSTPSRHKSNLQEFNAETNTMHKSKQDCDPTAKCKELCEHKGRAKCEGVKNASARCGVDGNICETTMMVSSTRREHACASGRNGTMSTLRPAGANSTPSTNLQIRHLWNPRLPWGCQSVIPFPVCSVSGLPDSDL